MPFKLPKYKFILVLNDFILICLSSLSAFLINSHVDISGTIHFLINNTETIFFSFLFGFIFIFIFQSHNLYKINVLLTHALQLAAIIKSFFYGSVSLILFAFLFKFSFLLNSRRFVLLFIIIGIVLLVVSRLLLLRTLFIKFSNSIGVKRNVVVLGGGRAGKLLSAKLLFEEGLAVNILGFIDDNIPRETEILKGVKVLGDIKSMKIILDENDVDEIIIAIDNVTYDRLLNILDLCNQTDVLVKITSELFEIVPQKMETEEYSGIPVVNVSPQMKKRFVIFLKRIGDIIGALIGLILLSPVLFFVSILIKLSSKGPIFYVHERIGCNGKPFKFYKFRSMRPAADDDSKRKEQMLKFMREDKAQNDCDTKIINEDRVTWIGEIIRKTSIDELPQLINVLKGEMSLVGPRPCLPYEYENYDEWQKRRLEVLPGCTGVWQVFGRSNVSFKDSVVLDIYYINNMSPWLDLQLIFKTIPVMLFSRGGK